MIYHTLHHAACVDAGVSPHTRVSIGGLWETDGTFLQLEKGTLSIRSKCQCFCRAAGTFFCCENVSSLESAWELTPGASSCLPCDAGISIATRCQTLCHDITLRGNANNCVGES